MTISMARTGLADREAGRLRRAYVPREQAAHVRATIDEWHRLHPTTGPSVKTRRSSPTRTGGRSMPTLTPEERAEMDARHATPDGLQTIAPTLHTCDAMEQP
jgi:hypothetical protein